MEIQSITQSVDFKKIQNGSYVIMSQSGTKISNSEIVKLCKTYIKYGVGEILLNDVNNDGSLLGFDVNFLRNISTKVKCPIIVLGGAGKWEHILEIFKKTNIQAAYSKYLSFYRGKYNICKKKFLKNKKLILEFK